MSDTVITGDYLEKARAIVTAIEAGDDAEAHRIVEELSKQRDTSLFQQLGELTRSFHEALNSFRLDTRLTELAGKEIPDARERLEYVIEMTEKSAHLTLNVVEESLPVCERMEADGKNIQESWQRFMRREMEPQEFRELCKEIDAYFDSLNSNSGMLKKGLTDILMAQDFQDITGQIISRVIRLVSDLEDSLVTLVRDSGVPVDKSEAVSKGEKGKLDGPYVPGIESEGSVSGQDEVDDLLSSLGF